VDLLGLRGGEKRRKNFLNNYFRSRVMALQGQRLVARPDLCINAAALVTIAQCNTLVARCSRQLIGPADWVFVTLGSLRCD